MDVLRAASADLNPKRNDPGATEHRGRLWGERHCGRHCNVRLPTEHMRAHSAVLFCSLSLSKMGSRHPALPGRSNTEEIERASDVKARRIKAPPARPRKSRNRLR